MKLRARSLESKETHRIEVPNSCNLQQLKEAITRVVSPSSSSSSSAMDGTLLLSLNRKDELCGSSPDESLQSLGITSGDLIYYSGNPFAFSSQNPNLSTAQSNPNYQNQVIVDTQKPGSSNSVELIDASDQNRELMGAQKECSSKLSDPNEKADNLVDLKKEEPVEVAQSIEKTEGSEDMEIDDGSVLEANSKFSVPSFLKKVFVKEVGDAANGGDHKLLVIAVHAVLLESGFVAYDPVSGMRFVGFHLHDEWPKSAFGLSLHYTLPELASSEVVETVVLKFQTLGRFLNIYGSVPKKGFGAHRVCLDESRFAPALSFILKHRDHPDSGKLYPNREIFEFWKIVKDGLSYPLLIDLCEKLGLILPPCFMRLPIELKLKILEALPATDIARVSCVSSELHFIASNNELWRLKYEEEFGIAADPQRECQWKAKFSSAWEIRKKRKRICMPYPWREPLHFRPLFPGRRDPNFPGSPFIIGGDNDRLPSFGFPQRHGPRIFRWNCDLGRFGP